MILTVMVNKLEICFIMMRNLLHSYKPELTDNKSQKYINIVKKENVEEEDEEYDADTEERKNKYI